MLFIACVGWSFSQERTVGTLAIQDGVYEGYTLFSPAGNTSTYLINNCGELLHQWDSEYPPGNAVYLQEDGSIFRASRVEGARLGEPGVGGRIEQISWDNEVIWSYVYSNDTVNQHHDFHVMPNGNVLVLAWDLKTFEEAVQAGRDPMTLSDNELWPDHIVEVEPGPNNSGEIIWVWHSWDHLIQDFDPTKDNFGVVEDNPGKIDVNYRLNDDADWHHVNSINYSEENDYIILSVPFFDEIWIIDHDLTTAEAKGPAGDLLFRWGNPLTYKQGTEADQKLFFQHTAEWVAEGLPNAGEIIIFNNGRGRTPDEYSSIVFLNPFDTEGNFSLEDGTFGPDSFTKEYTRSTPTDFFASFISGAQQLPNGNILIDNGPVGTFFEVTNTNEIVWEYKNPVSTTLGIVEQSDEISGNLVFRATKYSLAFEAFRQRNLEPSGFIEGNGSLPSDCTVLSLEQNPTQVSFYPNPAVDKIIVDGDMQSVQIFDLQGNMMYEKFLNGVEEVDLTNFESGLYLLHANSQTQKLIINK